MVQNTSTLHGVFMGEQIALQLGMQDTPWTSTLEELLAPGGGRDGLLQEWLHHFLRKQRDYGDGATTLGAPGQYAELHRKMAKLKRALWDGVPLENEPVREVLMDLIGHCFLAIQFLDSDNYGGKPTK